MSKKNDKIIKKERKKTTLIVLCAVILIVGYAFFAQPLAYNTALKIIKKVTDTIDVNPPKNNIKEDGTIIKTDKETISTNINSEKWNISFTKVIVKGVYGQATEITPVKYTSSEATFHIGLNEPEDKIIYEFTITNKGEFDAKLSSIELISSAPEDDTIIFKISNIKIGDTLKIGESKTMLVTIEYNPKINQNIKYYNETAQIVINYVQD